MSEHVGTMPSFYRRPVIESRAIASFNMKTRQPQSVVFWAKTTRCRFFTEQDFAQI